MIGIFANGYGFVIITGSAFGLGFLTAAALFLGFGPVRTTEDARNSLVVDRRAAKGRRCTAVTARWCPLHGHCTCVQDDDGMDTVTDEYNMDDHDCPLHGARSLHAA